MYTVAFRPEALCWNRMDNRVAGECEKPDKDWKRHLYRGRRLFVFVLHELYDKPEAAQPIERRRAVRSAQRMIQFLPGISTLW